MNPSPKRKRGTDDSLSVRGNINYASSTSIDHDADRRQSLQYRPVVRKLVLPIGQARDRSTEHTVAGQLGGLDLHDTSVQHPGTADVDHSEAILAVLDRKSPDRVAATSQEVDVSHSTTEAKTTSIKKSPASVNIEPQIFADLKPTSPNSTTSPTSPRRKKRHKSPPLPNDGNSTDSNHDHHDNTATTWHQSEITGHQISTDDPNDDGYGINGIGFKPTPAVAWIRYQKRKQQLAEYKSREMREARQKRSERRQSIWQRQYTDASSEGFEVGRELSPTEMRGEGKTVKKRRAKVRFDESSC